MNRSPIRLRTVVLLLGALLATPWATAVAELRSEGTFELASPSPQSFLGQLWERLAALWEKEGAHIDPYGSHTTTVEEPAPSDHEDIGPLIDPYGAR